MELRPCAAPEKITANCETYLLNEINDENIKCRDVLFCLFVGFFCPIGLKHG